MLNFDNDNKKSGYVLFWRSFIDWEWFTDVNTCHLFQYCIFRANYVDTEWHGIKIARGSFITSLETLAIATGLTKMQVRTSLKKLKLTGEITHQSTSRYSIITVKNYSSYQDYNTVNNTQITRKEHTNNTQITTDNTLIHNTLIHNNNNIISSSCKNEEKTTSTASDISDLNINRIKDLKNFYGEYSNVHLTERQLDALKVMVPKESILEELINQLSENIEQGKEELYDEKRPAIHYIRLKKYWIFRNNQLTQPQNTNSKKSARQRVVDYLINTGQMTKEGEFIE